MTANQLDLSLSVAKKGENISAFIPVTSHYDPNILITQNGDLLCTITIDGSLSSNHDQQITIRQMLRAALLESIDSYKIGVYIHVIRSAKNIIIAGQPLLGGALTIEKAWNQHHNWSQTLENSLYITLVHQRTPLKPWSLSSLLPNIVTKRAKLHLAESAQKLHSIADKLCHDLSALAARKLGMVQQNVKIYSEPLSFFYYLTHLQNKEVFPPFEDYSAHLADAEFWCGFNSLRIDCNQQSRHAVLFTFKEMPYVNDYTYEELLQVDCDLIFCEQMIFVDAKTARAPFKKHLETMEMGDQLALAQQVGLYDAAHYSSNRVADYCLLQTNMLCHAATTSDLQQKINTICRITEDIGSPIVREDYNMMRCFWSMLPGKHQNTGRLRYSTINRIGNFSCIHHRDMGNKDGSIWGKPIALLRSIKGRSFYFNFHDHTNSGHTLLVSPPDGDAMLLAKFLLAQSIKLSARIIAIDLDGSMKNFIDKIGGTTVQINAEQSSPIQLDPFSEDAFYKNQDFFEEWLLNALPEQLPSDALKALTNSSTDERLHKFQDLLETLKATPQLADIALKLQNGIWNNLYGAENLKDFKYQDIFSIDLSTFNDKAQQSAFITLLLLKIEQIILDKRQTIIFFNHADILFKPQFVNIMQYWLDRLTRANAIAFLQFQGSLQAEASPQLKQLLTNFVTKIFAVNNLVNRKFKNSYGLSEREFNEIKNYSADSGLAIIKQGTLAVTASYQFDQVAEIGRIIL